MQKKRKDVLTIFLVTLGMVYLIANAIFVVRLDFLEEEDLVQDTIPQFTISPYDSLFQQYADSIGWDWKLLAAVAYVESKFDTAATSQVGAKGLMQLMPSTAEAMGIPAGMERDPEWSVKAASEYFYYLDRLFRYVPKAERTSFILASYNAGFGHVHDAMRLARKHGKNRLLWNDNVEDFLLLKNDSIYYTDSLCRNGQFAGVETTQFVNKVTRQYQRYQRAEEAFLLEHTPPQPEEALAADTLATDTLHRHRDFWKWLKKK